MPVRIFCACLIALLIQVANASAQSCTFTAPDVDFGTLLEPTTNADVSSTFAANCTGTAGQRIVICAYLGPGTGGATGVTRRMYVGGVAGVGTAINYVIKLTPGAGSPQSWGPASPGTGTMLEIVTGNIPAGGTITESKVYYGSLVAGQTGLDAGDYFSSFGGADARVTWAYRATGYTGCAGTFDASRANSTLSFRARINGNRNCTVVAGDLDFGAHADLSDTAKSATSTITVNCTSGTAYDIALDNGLYSTAAMARRMRHSATLTEFVSYNIYKPASTTAWGSAVADRVTGTGTGAAVNLTAVGNVPVQTTPIPGDYADTVIVTVNY